MGRFLSPDPLFIAAHRIADPQLWNLYQYARDNPLRLTDSTGLDIKLDCSQASPSSCSGVVNDLNNRKGAEFSVSRNTKTGLLEVDGKVDASKLSKGESALYSAIMDTGHHAILSLVNQSDTVQFGRFEGNGHNTIDVFDLNLLNKASSEAAGETVAHEGLEAYGSSFGNGSNYLEWHGYANQFFGQVTNGPENLTMVPHGSDFYTQDWNFHRLGTDLQVITVVTPQPVQTIPQAYTPGRIIDVEPANPNQ